MAKNLFDYLKLVAKSYAAGEKTRQEHAKLIDKGIQEGFKAKDKITGDLWTDVLNKTGLSSYFKGITGQTSAEATLAANKMNIENQNYWNEKVMQREDTAHQREVADLQAAGLNPWLSMGNGAQSVAMNTAQADPVDGSKILSATSAAALLAITKLLLKK